MPQTFSADGTQPSREVGSSAEYSLGLGWNAGEAVLREPGAALTNRRVGSGVTPAPLTWVSRQSPRKVPVYPDR